MEVITETTAIRWIAQMFYEEFGLLIHYHDAEAIKTAYLNNLVSRFTDGSWSTTDRLCPIEKIWKIGDELMIRYKGMILTKDESNRLY